MFNDRWRFKIKVLCQLVQNVNIRNNKGWLVIFYYEYNNWFRRDKRTLL